MLYVQNVFDFDDLELAAFGAQRLGTAVDGDSGYINYRIKASNGLAQDFARLRFQANTVNSSAKDGELHWQVQVNNTLTTRLTVNETGVSTTGSFTHTGGLNDTVTFTWSTTGTQAITVTALNAAGTVTDTHDITIESLSLYTVFLPIIVKP